MKRILALASVVLVLVAGGRVNGGVTLTTVVSFAGTNGSTPMGNLVEDDQGNLFGVTQGGGEANAGTVFKLSTVGVLTTLASFENTNGALPHAGLVKGTNGNFYGTTSFGGTFNQGTVFRITPDGALTSLFSFDGTNAAQPTAELVQGGDGFLYGTTKSGGLTNDPFSIGCGTVFRMTSDGLLSFVALFNTTNTVGLYPWAALTLGRDGNLYGTTRDGGAYYSNAINSGSGTFFKMTPLGQVTTVVPFDLTNGYGSLFAAVQGNDGNFYGTGEVSGTYEDGSGQRLGNVYRVTPSGMLTTVFSFSGTNGALPRGLTLAKDGNFYGMTAFGGIGYANNFMSGNGTVFQVTPGGGCTTLYFFTNSEMPFGGLFHSKDGRLYGMTRSGGDYGLGRIFRLSVAMPPFFQSVFQVGNTVKLTWSAVSGQNYQLEYSSDLSSPNWAPLGSLLAATNGTATSTDVVGTNSQRFYRVALLP